MRDQSGSNGQTANFYFFACTASLRAKAEGVSFWGRKAKSSSVVEERGTLAWTFSICSSDLLGAHAAPGTWPRP